MKLTLAKVAELAKQDIREFTALEASNKGIDDLDDLRYAIQRRIVTNRIRRTHCEGPFRHLAGCILTCVCYSTQRLRGAEKSEPFKECPEDVGWPDVLHGPDLP
jgi:hypothetical protein